MQLFGSAYHAGSWCTACGDTESTGDSPVLGMTPRAPAGASPRCSRSGFLSFPCKVLSVLENVRRQSHNLPGVGGSGSIRCCKHLNGIAIKVIVVTCYQGSDSITLYMSYIILKRGAWFYFALLRRGFPVNLLQGLRVSTVPTKPKIKAMHKHRYLGSLNIYSYFTSCLGTI